MQKNGAHRCRIMPFEFAPCAASDGAVFAGLCKITPKLFKDGRGLFFESYSERDFFAVGIDARFVQDNQSRSCKNVLRGLHFQARHSQGKLASVVLGRVYDVAVDLRRGSATFGKHYGLILDGEKHEQLYIPPGFAHGFYVLSDVAIFAYKSTDFYRPEDEAGLMWNDPLIGIDWAGATGGEFAPILSEKDGKYPAFDPLARYFNIEGKWEGV